MSWRDDVSSFTLENIQILLNFLQGLLLAMSGVIAVVFKPITLIHDCTFWGIDSFKFYEAGFVYFCSFLFQKGHGSVAVI